MTARQARTVAFIERTLGVRLGNGDPWQFIHDNIAEARRTAAQKELDALAATPSKPTVFHLSGHEAMREGYSDASTMYGVQKWPGGTLDMRLPVSDSDRNMFV